MKDVAFACFALLCLATPALAGVVVDSPVNGSVITSPFSLSAKIQQCSGQTIAAMGYSLDYGTTTIVKGVAAMAMPVNASPGGHTLHVRAWGNSGAICITDVAITVTAVTAAVPPNARSNSGLQALDSWIAAQDLGTPGEAAGAMSMSGKPAVSGHALHFTTTYADYGGERYSVAFGDDTEAENFLYDAYIYIANSTSGIMNIEMDLNQVMANGQTVIYGVQCDGWTGTWDYTTNAGTPQNFSDEWLHSSASCSPQNWSAHAWHHVQLFYSRDTTGDVTYHYVELDGNVQTIEATAPSAFALGWGPVLLTNFQVDGGTFAGGTTNLYLDNLTVSRW